jgi:hypothetical protein
MTISEQLDKILDKYPQESIRDIYGEYFVGISIEDAFNAMMEAYDLGKDSKFTYTKVREIDNPYNIDYKRQTKIEF